MEKSRSQLPKALGEKWAESLHLQGRNPKPLFKNISGLRVISKSVWMYLQAGLSGYTEIGGCLTELLLMWREGNRVGDRPNWRFPHDRPMYLFIHSLGYKYHWERTTLVEPGTREYKTKWIVEFKFHKMPPLSGMEKLTQLTGRRSVKEPHATSFLETHFNKSEIPLLIGDHVRMGRKKEPVSPTCV